MAAAALLTALAFDASALNIGRPSPPPSVCFLVAVFLSRRRHDDSKKDFGGEKRCDRSVTQRQGGLSVPTQYPGNLNGYPRIERERRERGVL